MTLKEIKQAIAKGKRVYWKDPNYEVIKDKANEYLIKSHFNNHCIGLVWADNTTLNGKEIDFYIGE